MTGNIEELMEHTMCCDQCDKARAEVARLRAALGTIADGLPFDDAAPALTMLYRRAAEAALVTDKPR
jgi:hypothetical protein